MNNPWNGFLEFYGEQLTVFSTQGKHNTLFEEEPFYALYKKLNFVLQKEAQPSCKDSCLSLIAQHLCHASYYQDGFLIQMLLDYGANVHAVDSQGRTLLDWARSYENTEITH